MEQVNDIVERLRAARDWTDDPALGHLLHDAEAEIERLRWLLREARGSLAYAFGDQCDEYDEGCEGCHAWKLIKRIDAALGTQADQPPIHDCGKPLKLGQHGECVWCGYMPDKNYPSDQPDAAHGCKLCGFRDYEPGGLVLCTRPDCPGRPSDKPTEGA